jgi:hypothetical protein
MKKNKNNNMTSKKDYYTDKFLNTSNLPRTLIIKYINNNYSTFLKEKEIDNVSSSSNPNQFSFFFDIKNDFIKGNKVNIDQTLEKNTKMNTDKLLAYALYLKSSDFFKEKGALDTTLLKSQIGKDSTRMPIYINKNLYSFLPKSGDLELSTNDEKADFFILKIIDYLSNLNEKIDYNLINKIGITCCQNLFNLIIDQLTITIMQAIAPEFCAFMNGKKYVEFTLTESSKIAKLFFSSSMIISHKQNLDPEFKCGKIDFILLIDYSQNDYFFEKFNLEYDADMCNPLKEEQQQQDLINNNQVNGNNGNKFNINFDKYKYLIPAAAVTGAVVATPFILGVVGGKTKTKKKNRKSRKNKRKTRKYKKKV